MLLCWNISCYCIACREGHLQVVYRVSCFCYKAKTEKIRSDIFWEKLLWWGSHGTKMRLSEILSSYKTGVPWLIERNSNRKKKKKKNEGLVLILRKNKWDNQEYGNSWWSMRKKGKVHADRDQSQVADSVSKGLLLSWKVCWMWEVKMLPGHTLMQETWQTDWARSNCRLQKGRDKDKVSGVDQQRTWV